MTAYFSEEQLFRPWQHHWHRRIKPWSKGSQIWSLIHSQWNNWSSSSLSSKELPKYPRLFFRSKLEWTQFWYHNKLCCWNKIWTFSCSLCVRDWVEPTYKWIRDPKWCSRKRELQHSEHVVKCQFNANTVCIRKMKNEKVKVEDYENDKSVQSLAQDINSQECHA